MRIIVHTMHETETEAARTMLADPTVTDSFVLGTGDAAMVEALRKDGLIVQVIDSAAGPAEDRPETPGLGAAALRGQRRPSVFTAHTFAQGAVDTLPDLGQPNIYLVQIPGPLLDGYHDQLAALGVALLQSFGASYYTATMTFAQRQAVGRLPFVANVMLYDSEQTLPGKASQLEALGSAPIGAATAARIAPFDIRLHLPEDMASVRAWLNERKVPVAGAEGQKIRIYAMEDSSILAELGGLNGVQSIEEFVPPKFFNDRARALVNLDGAAGPMVPYDGMGEIIGIADSGLDDTHADFAGRLLALIPRGRPGLTDDPHGHGTHVAGSAAGSGAASAGAVKGMAPKAQIVFQSLLDNAGGLGLPLDLGTLFGEAYNLGARIHNNSWGAATASTYAAHSNDLDIFVASHRDMLIVVAAGNEGQASTRQNSALGVVDWLSIGAPATAKNALTVGASRSDRSNGAYGASQWGQLWPSNFPNPPVSQELVSGDPESMAGFSSRGPSDDRRIKPDLVAPGTDILSCRSAKAPGSIFWGPYAANAAYAYMGGTSMAAPLVSGAAALVRQYFRQTRGHDPSAALLRATLVNGARWLQGADSNASNAAGAVPAANFDQGFGRLDIATAIPGGDNAFQLEFSDDWQSPAGKLAATGSRRRFVAEVEAGAALRICLAYTDVPGRGLQNNLNLLVQSPQGTKYLGNGKLRLALSTPDADNNVERVSVADPAPGYWTIQISATNLLQPGQDFALVVTGRIKSGLTTI